MNKFLAAVIQMDSQSDVENNLETAAEFIEEAVSRGAKLITMPENMNYAGPDSAGRAEPIPGGRTWTLMADLAKKHTVWLHCGSIYETNKEYPRPYNTTMLISPRGELAVKYSKIHPFDVVITNGPNNRESDRICPGKEIVTFDTGEVGHLGLSICYDMRFVELYPIVALEGAQILLVPSDFTTNTCKDHWEPILRARAIENACYVRRARAVGRQGKVSGLRQIPRGGSLGHRYCQGLGQALCHYCGN